MSKTPYFCIWSFENVSGWPEWATGNDPERGPEFDQEKFNLTRMMADCLLSGQDAFTVVSCLK